MRGLTFPERQIPSAARQNPLYLRQGAVGSQVGVQFAWSGVLIGELLQSLFSRDSSSTQATLSNRLPRVEQYFGKQATYPTGGLGVAG